MYSSNSRLAAAAIAAAAVLVLVPTLAYASGNSFSAPTHPSSVTEDPPSEGPGDSFDPDVPVVEGEGGAALRDEDQGYDASEFAPVAAANDNYSNAATLVPTWAGGGYATVSGTTVDATTQSGEKTRTADGDYNYRVAHTVWYKWKAPASGTITVWTGGSLSDSTLGIFTGSSISSAERKAFNDYDSTTPSDKARITGFKVTKGKTYRIQVGVHSSLGVASPGAFTLTLTGTYKSAGDHNSLAEADNKGDTTSFDGSENTLGSTIETEWEPVDNPDYPSFDRANSVWWKWTPKAGALVDVTTNGSQGDTYLAIFRHSATNGLAEIDFDDESGSLNDASIQNIQLNAGYTYYFQVGHIGVGSVSQLGSNVELHFDAEYNGPTVSQVSPSSGPDDGGTTITITGTRLTTVNTVLINGYGANTIVHLSSTKITAHTPASSIKEKRYITVCTPSFGCSKLNKSADFTFK